MFGAIKKCFAAVSPAVDFSSLRFVRQRSQTLCVRQDVVQPVREELDIGAMVTVLHDGGLGYAATADLSDSGLESAFARAARWAARTAKASVHDFRDVQLPHSQGTFRSPVENPWASLGTRAKLDMLRGWSARLHRDARIVDWEAVLWNIEHETLYLTNRGGRVHQIQHLLSPHLSATAHANGETQTRSLGFFGDSQQGGLEVVDRAGVDTRPEELADEAIELLSAPNCPSERMDLVLAPDQMMLQIHESIGHPLELDRILGDERNYAGTSFVTLDMIGSFRYGSELLNVIFDPACANEFAAYAFDDDGSAARPVRLIEAGILKRPLGGLVSRARAGLAESDGVANARASAWNRPSIDRMANLNVEPGDSSFDDMIRSVKRGIFMRTNCSWSIDDSRNKFQFGCEWGQLIEDGTLTTIVKNPNYRGVSATFWRSLAMVGDTDTFRVHGAPYCGKGEPNQLIRVGHASPACLFRDVEVFGGV